MKTIHHICNAFFLGFEGFCIMMAVYMTYKQLIMFYQNEDFSQIFIEKFTDGPNDKYPTYKFVLMTILRNKFTPKNT